MTRHGIDLSSEAVRAFCAKWKIKELAIFGSILRDDFRPDSDIDVVVDFDDATAWDLSDLGFMRRELSEILGRDIDLVTRGALKHTDNWLFRKIVLSELETVYASR